jgi:hypothetical protein
MVGHDTDIALGDKIVDEEDGENYIVVRLNEIEAGSRPHHIEAGISRIDL